MKLTSFNVCGVRVDNVTFASVLSSVEHFVREGGLHLIVTPNVDYIVTAQRDHQFLQALNASALSIPDGTWLQRGARLVGIPIRESIGGRLLVEPLCQMAAQNGWSVSIIASVGDVAVRAAENLGRKYDGLNVVMARSPSMRFGRDSAETELLLSELQRLRPDLLFLGVGAPKGERWLHENRARIPVRVAIGVGYAFDVIAGRITECPPWISRAGMEWAYRLAKEPKRLSRRYLVRDPRFLGLLIRQKLRRESSMWPHPYVRDN